MRRLRIIFICSSFVFFYFNCSVLGGRGKLKFKHLSYPVSMTGTIVNKNGEITRNYQVIREIQYKKQFWSIFYSLWNWTDDEEVDIAINEFIRTNNGNGIVNFRVTSELCKTSQNVFLGFIPFWPGCSTLTFEGQVVRINQTGDVNLNKNGKQILKIEKSKTN